MFCKQHGAVASGKRGAAAAGLIVLLGGISSACVPVPYRPSAKVNHGPIQTDEAAAIRLRAEPARGWPTAIAKSIQEVEPRVVVLDGLQYAGSVLTPGGDTLSGVLAAMAESSSPVLDADYLLCVGTPKHRQLHDTGLAAPFVLFPAFWVGYEKVQSLDTLPASLVDLHHPQQAEGLLAASAYTEVIAALVYGVGTIAMPEPALRKALAEEVAHRLANGHPSGPIRVIVVAQINIADESNKGIATPADSRSRGANLTAATQAP